MIAEAGAEAAADGRRPSTYRIVLPDGWWRIDLSEGQAQSIERLVEQVFRGLDDAPLLKQDLRARLTAQAEAAREIGGIELYLSMMVAEPATIPASLLVGLTPPAPEQVMPLEALVEPFAAEPGAVEVSLVDLPSGPAVRRRSRKERSLDPDAGPDAAPDAGTDPAGEASPDALGTDALGTEALVTDALGIDPEDLPRTVETFGVEYHLPVPEGHGAFLVLTFSSPLTALEDALVELFDAVATTLRWVW